MALFGRKKTTVGLDIGSGLIKLVAIQHGGGGHATIEVVSDGSRTGLRLAFEDAGPGIAEIALAMKDGYSTSGGLGLGL